MNAQLDTRPDSLLDADEAYITRRIVDTCLRENLRDIASLGQATTPNAIILDAWPHAHPPLWWRVAHLPGGVVWIPVAPCDYMQDIGALSHGWIREQNGNARYEEGAAHWLHLVSDGLDEQTRALHRQYADEAACAAAHRGLAREGFARHSAQLAQALRHDDAFERALLCDQVASHRDHPFYPTARAKSGFDAADLHAYAPEFAPAFELRWLAVPRDVLTLTTAPPAFWPTMATLGLSADLDPTHYALPVHPFNWVRLDDFGLPPGSIRAAQTYLAVRPTLSVRTVVPVEHPRHHIKLPLLMRTLGALNLRLIKPSTIYDGHWFERVLNAIGEHDDKLHSRYVHVDESHGGHVQDARHLAYIVRAYPAPDKETILPVAALCAPMPDRRPLATHVADRYYNGDMLAWWREYAALLCDVHLRLWLRHGIALESNQQNAALIYRTGVAPRLLMKDNDAARTLLPRLLTELPELNRLGLPRDERIVVDDDDALARMFCTITLQLCLLAVLEGIAEYEPIWRLPFYQILCDTLDNTLATLRDEGIDIQPARRLLGADRLPVKYLLSAGSLLSKQATGAADINKFYGDSGPNFLLNPQLRGGAG
jgi:siderophore synthetase component